MISASERTVPPEKGNAKIFFSCGWPKADPFQIARYSYYRSITRSSCAQLWARRDSRVAELWNAKD